VDDGTRRTRLYRSHGASFETNDGFGVERIGTRIHAAIVKQHLEKKVKGAESLGDHPRLSFIGNSMNVSHIEAKDLADNTAATLPKKTFKVKIYPTQENKDIWILEGVASFEIVNTLGKVLLQARQKQVNVARLPSGDYIVQGRDENGAPFSTKMVR
jgi:hypothetical protein